MRIAIPALCSILALGLTACVGGQSPAARFFQLQPLAPATAAEPGLDPALFIVVKPVALESYLRQPQMAERTETHEVSYREFRRWAEPLDRNITRVLTENLRRLLKTDQVAVLGPWAQDGKHVTVMVEIKRFERQPDGRVLLSAGWLVRPADGQAHKLGTFEATSAVTSREAPDIAAAQSELLLELSARVADAIKTIGTTAQP